MTSSTGRYVRGLVGCALVLVCWTTARGASGQLPSSEPLPPLPAPPRDPSYDTDARPSSPRPPARALAPASTPTSPELGTSAAAAAPEERGGWVARVSAGAALGMNLERGVIDPGNGSIYGGGPAFDVFLGGALHSTFALGVHIANIRAEKPIVQVDGRTLATTRDLDVLLVGAMGEAYLEPTGGLHFAAASRLRAQR